MADDKTIPVLSQAKETVGEVALPADAFETFLREGRGPAAAREH